MQCYGKFFCNHGPGVGVVAVVAVVVVVVVVAVAVVVVVKVVRVVVVEVVVDVVVVVVVSNNVVLNFLKLEMVVATSGRILTVVCCLTFVRSPNNSLFEVT